MQRNRQTDPDLTPICDASEALLAAEAMAAKGLSDFADFSEEDLEPTRAMQREDIPNEPMLLARRASKPPRDSEDPVYPEAAVPEVVDFAERMESEPPAAIVPAPRVSKFVAQVAPATPPPAAGARPSASPGSLAASPSIPTNRPPAKPVRPTPMFPTAGGSPEEDGSLASATVESPAPTPAAPPAVVVARPDVTPLPAPPPAAPAREARANRARAERGQQGALIFLGVCALAATGLIGVSVGRSSVPVPAPQAAAPTAPTVAQPVAAKVDPHATQSPTGNVAPTVGANDPSRGQPRAVGVPGPRADKALGGSSGDKAAKEPLATPEPSLVEPPPATQPAPADGPAAPAFDASAATNALAALSGSVQSCGGNAGGTARVAVTFSPSGRVTQAIVEGAPYAGTPAGGCIAAKARGASIPAFSGAPVTVRKTYTMN